jgi:hypothetical protein
MAVKKNIDVTMQDELHLLIFFACARCGEMICSKGIANNYRYPMWFIEKPIVPADDSYFCYSCAKGLNEGASRKVAKVQRSKTIHHRGPEDTEK